MKLQMRAPPISSAFSDAPQRKRLHHVQASFAARTYCMANYKEIVCGYLRWHLLGIFVR
jgi:hypothetical protein